VPEELVNAQKEHKETIKLNVNNIFKITGILEYRLSEAEKSKSLLIEELQAENGKEVVLKAILAKIAQLNCKLAIAESGNKLISEINWDNTKEINRLMHEKEQLMAEDSTEVEAANLEAEITKHEQSELKNKMSESND
jgi:hypothetical protein